MCMSVFVGLATIVLRDEVDPEVFYDEDELSTDTLDTQVLRISNDLRKVLNTYNTVKMYPATDSYT